MILGRPTAVTCEPADFKREFLSQLSCFSPITSVNCSRQVNGCIPCRGNDFEYVVNWRVAKRPSANGESHRDASCKLLLGLLIVFVLIPCRFQRAGMAGMMGCAIIERKASVSLRTEGLPTSRILTRRPHLVWRTNQRNVRASCVSVRQVRRPPGGPGIA